MGGLLLRIYGFKALDALMLIYPVYAVMFVDHGLTPFQVSATLLAFTVTGLVVQIPAGVLADRLPRRWILAAGQVARAVGYGFWFAWPDFAGAFIGLALWGVKSAMTNGVFEALVYDELAARGREADYARVIGRAVGVSYISTLAAALGAAAAIRFGYGFLLVASMIAAVGAAGAALALPQAARALATGRNPFALLRAGFGFVLRSPAVLAIVGMAAVSNAFGGGMEAFWPIFGAGAGLSAAAVPLFSGAISLAQVVGSTQAHRLAGAREPLFHGLFAGIGLVIAAAAAFYTPLSAGLIIVAAGLFKVIDVGFDARLHRAIPTESRATLAAVKTFSGLALMTLVLTAFGPVAQALSYRVGFIAVGAAMAVIGVAWLAVGALRRRTKSA